MAYTKVKSKNINQKLSYSHSPSRLLCALTGFTLLTTLILGLSLSSTKVSGTSTTANAAVTVSSACTMTGTLNTPHTTTVNPGVYQANIGKTTFSVICNDPNGFAIYAIGYTGEEYSGTNHTRLVGPNSNTITTGTATSGSTSNWAMKLESNDPEFYNMTIMNGYDSYSTIPDTYTKVAQITSSTASATPATMSSTYAAFIASDQTAGTYNGKVKYTMVHPYDTAVPIIPVCSTPVPNLTYMQDLNSSNKSNILSDMVEDKQYFLKDKRDQKSYCVAKLKDGNIWMTQNLDHDIVTTTNYYSNQNTDIGWNGSSYDTATWTSERATYSTETTTWNDQNGGTVYGYNQPESYDPGNLYLNQDYIDYQINSERTHAYISSCYSGACNENIYDELPHEFQLYLDSCVFDDSTDEGPCNESLFPLPPSVTSSFGAEYYHLGNYYNWSAAVAMNDTSSYTDRYQNVDQSICPTNWTLPKSGPNSTSSSSFRYLIEQSGDGYVHNIGHPPILDDGLRTVYAGTWFGSYSEQPIGSSGTFWSSTLRGDMVAYRMRVEGYSDDSYNTSYIDPGVSDTFGYDPRAFGNSIRCVAR